MEAVTAKVYLLGRSVPVGTIDESLNAQRIIAAAGKLCYSKNDIKTLYEGLDDEATKKFVTMLTNLGHESPLEHISFTFGIEGISRACSHQLVRHRLASYSQQSQRYVDLNESFSYILPEEIKGNQKAIEVFEDILKNDIKAYEEIYKALVEEYTVGVTDKKQLNLLKKKALENARAVLPNACETKIIATMNARSLLNFFEHRMCTRAQEEVRDIANQMLDIVLNYAPDVFKKAGASCTFGPCKEGSMTCGIKQKPKQKQLELNR